MTQPPADTADHDLPPGWAEAIRAILFDRIRRTLVLGPVDAGKSTFCRALCAAAGEAAVLDCDPGQKLVGPPAAVTLGRPGDTHPAALGFIGTTSPLKGWRPLIAAIEQLAASPAGPLVANTGGLLDGAGRRLKAAKIAAFRPDRLVAIGDHAALDAILADHPGLPAHRLAPSPLARRKTPGARRAARREAFRRYFEPADIVTADPPAEADVDATPLVERQLVGLRGPDGADLALGLVAGFAADGPAILTPSPVAPGCILLPGLLRLDDSFAEQPLAAGGTGRPSG